jgi:enediyne biosynthesis protein E4
MVIQAILSSNTTADPAGVAAGLIQKYMLIGMTANAFHRILAADHRRTLARRRRRCARAGRSGRFLVRFFGAPFLLAFIAVSACAAAPGPAAGQCSPPRLTPSPLVVGDGVRDRGFPGGVSLVDVDGDGDLDLMATGGYSPIPRPEPPHYAYRANVLYLNDGAGRFSHSQEPALAPADHPFSGSSWGDVDRDGDLDAFIGTQHGRPDVFLRNLGGGRFAREELGEATQTPGSNFATSWVDIDNDGDLDLISGGPTLEPGQPLLIYRNDQGRFVRVRDIPLENGRSNAGAILWADFDNDGDQDLFVANSDLQRVNDIPPADYEGSQLYRNDGGWRFVRTEQPFNDRAFAATSAAVGDIDNDGDLDLYIGHSGYGHPEDGRDAVFLNEGDGRFSQDARFVGHLHGTQTTSAALVDLDLDGDLDLLTTVYSEGVRLFVNDGSGAFAPVEDRTLLAREGHYWGAASGDIDGDGDLDLALGNWGETAEGDYVTILRNESALCGRPLRMTLLDRHGAPDPIGARVTLVTRGPAGERRQLRESMAQSTMRSQSGSAFLFAAPAGERPVRAEIRWPDGTIQIVRRLSLAADNRIVEPAPAD